MATYELPSHYELSATCQVQRVAITSSFPTRDDFTRNGDAFAGKSFVRIPKLARGVPPARPARLRRDVPRYRDERRAVGQPAAFDSIWLPDHCIVADNSLEVARLRWAPPRPSRVHVGLGASLA